MQSEVIEISFDDKGVLWLPARIREWMHLAPGMKLVVESGAQGGVRLRVETKPSPLFEKDGILVARVTALSDLNDVTRNERDRRVFDLLQRVGL